MWESVTCPQLKFVKGLCFVLAIACVAGLYFHVYPSWLVVGIMAAILTVLAVWACCIQHQYNCKPWDHGGKKCNFSEKE